MSDFRTPISKPTGPQDMQDGLNMGNVQAKRMVPDAKNYADDKEVANRAKQEIWPLIAQARFDRKSVEYSWAELRRMGLLQHDNNQKYRGRSNAYLPIAEKNLNTQVTGMIKGIFPSDEYIDCVTRDDDKEKGLRAKHYMQYQFEKIAFLRMYMKLFMRQLVRYGWSVLKFWYRRPQKYAKARAKRITGTDLMGAFSDFAPDFQVDTQEQGLTVSARSIFNFYAYPFTAETLRETTLQFEDIRMSKPELDYWAKVEGWRTEYLDGAPKPQDLQTDSQENFAAHNVPPGNDMQMGTQLGDIRMVTEAYTFMVLPPSEYTEADAPGCPLPVRIIFLGDEPVHIQRNSSYHQSSPFLGLSLNSDPGFLLGYGPGKMVQSLNYLGNDFVNQTNDVCIYGLNPVVKAIPGMLVGQLRPMAPGVTWYMNDLNAVDIMHPPTEQVQVGMAMLQMLMAMGQDFGGAPPVLQGTNAKGSGKTATGAQILQSNATQPLQDMVEDIETEVLVPLASRGWALGQQYAPDRILADVFGVMREITKDDLLFQAKWRWMASSQAANAQMRAYQATQFVQMLSPLIPLLQQQGVTVNLVPLLKRIYSDALGFRGVNDVFKEGMPAMLGAGMGQPGAAMGNPAAQAPRSPAESANGGSLEMQPGEGGGFDDVRENADMLSALMGSAQGGGNYEP